MLNHVQSLIPILAHVCLSTSMPGIRGASVYLVSACRLLAFDASTSPSTTTCNTTQRNTPLFPASDPAGVHRHFLLFILYDIVDSIILSTPTPTSTPRPFTDFAFSLRLPRPCCCSMFTVFRSVRFCVLPRAYIPTFLRPAS